jgi:hypothetical protein
MFSFVFFLFLANWLIFSPYTHLSILNKFSGKSETLIEMCDTVSVWIVFFHRRFQQFCWAKRAGQWLERERPRVGIPNSIDRYIDRYILVLSTKNLIVKKKLRSSELLWCRQPLFTKGVWLWYLRFCLRLPSFSLSLFLTVPYIELGFPTVTELS